MIECKWKKIEEGRLNNKTPYEIEEHEKTGALLAYRRE
jgi:hypothetical protein